MAEWAYNPITGNLDRIGSGGGGGGNITISGDSGPPLNGDSFAFVGQEAGASNTPVMDVDTSTGDVVYANNTWWTPYVVDASVVPGLKGTYQTIQEAIDAAVTDGASLSVQKMIYIRFGTYTEDLIIPPGIFLRGDAMYGQPGAVPLYATILGNHTLGAANLFRAQGLYFVNPDSALDLFTNSGAINIFNMFQCVLDNSASTGYLLTSDFNYNQFVNCIFYGSVGVAGINMTGGMATFNFCSFPQGMGFDNTANLRIYDCSNVGVITNNNGSIFAYNTQFGAGGGPTCIQGTGASNLFHDCEFTCSGDAVDTPTSQACMVNCYLTPGSGANLCSAATPATTISAQAGCIYFHTDVSTNVTPTDGDLVLMVDSTSGPILVTMQAGGTRDRLWVIKDVAGQAAVNNITIQVQTGKLIDGLTTYVLNQAYQAVGLSRYNGEDFVSIWDANKGGSGTGEGFTSVNVQVLTASGTYTPTSGMVYCVVENVGGGAAAGGSEATGSSQSAPAGGGGGGEYALGVFDAATIGASQAVTIGAGGIAVSGNNPGGNGGTTSFGALLTALGGIGGSGAAFSAGATSNSGGLGGSGGTGGDLRFPGVYGGDGYFSGSDQMGHGGAGGGSRYSGGVKQNDTVNSAGSNGIGYGCGGSGSYNLGVTTARAGGNGSPGLVYITEYIGGSGGGGGSPFTEIVVNGPTTLNGAQIVKFITTAIDYNALITDYGIGVTSTATPRSIVLPTTGATAGQTWEIKDQGGNASVNNITITAEGGALIDNAASLLINGNYQGWTIRFDGTNFWTR
jgi:hypothetical protein